MNPYPRTDEELESDVEKCIRRIRKLFGRECKGWWNRWAKDWIKKKDRTGKSALAETSHMGCSASAGWRWWGWYEQDCFSACSYMTSAACFLQGVELENTVGWRDCVRKAFGGDILVLNTKNYCYVGRSSVFGTIGSGNYTSTGDETAWLNDVDSIEKLLKETKSILKNGERAYTWKLSIYFNSYTICPSCKKAIPAIHGGVCRFPAVWLKPELCEACSENVFR